MRKRLVVEIDEYYRDAIIRHREGTYGAQLPYYVVNSTLEAIANGTPYDKVIDEVTELLENEWGYEGMRDDVSRIMKGGAE